MQRGEAPNPSEKFLRDSDEAKIYIFSPETDRATKQCVKWMNYCQSTASTSTGWAEVHLSDQKFPSPERKGEQEKKTRFSYKFKKRNSFHVYECHVNHTALCKGCVDLCLQLHVFLLCSVNVFLLWARRQTNTAANSTNCT